MADKPRPCGAASSAQRAAGCAFLAALGVYLTTTGGSFATDLASYEVTKNLVEHGSVAMSYNVLDTEAERGVDGRYYAPVGIGHPLFGIPLYAAARAFQSLTGVRLGKPESLTKAAVVSGSAVAAAGCVAMAFLLAWKVAGSVRGAAVAAAALAFGTILWPYSKFGFNAPLAALCLATAVYGVWVGARERRAAALALGGIALGYAILTRHEMGVATLPVATWLFLETRHDRRQRATSALLVGTPVATAIVLWAFYNYVRFGHPLDTGLLRDPNVRFDTPLLVGLHGLLLSPGRSLFLYNPVTLAGLAGLLLLARHDRNTALLFGGLALVFLPVYAKLHQWDGGESYGPRYLVPILPFLVVPLASWFTPATPLLRPSLGGKFSWTPGEPKTPTPQRTRIGRIAFAGLVSASILVQLPGVLVDFSKVQRSYARARPNYSIALTRYTWEAAPLVLNTRTAVTAIPQNLRYLAGRATPPPVTRAAPEQDRDFAQQFAFSLDFWWLYLFYLGALPAAAAVAVGAVPLAIGLACALKLRRLLRAPA